jgi:uncharacterized protein
MRRSLFAFVVLVLALFASVARATEYVPPPIAGHVTDAAGKLTSSEIAALDDKLAGYRKCSGNHIAVFFARSLEGNSVEDVAYITFNTWKIGEAKKDNGVLLVLAPNERKIRIETGKGVGGQLTDLESAHILRDVVGPNMKAERFFAAADQATTRIGSALGGCAIADVGDVASTNAPPAPYVPPPPPPAPDLHMTERVWMAVGIAFLVLLAGTGASRSGVRGIGPALFFTAVVTFISVIFMSIVGHEPFDAGFDLDAASLVFGIEALLLVFINIGIWIHRFRGGTWASTSGWTGSSPSDWSSSSSSSSSSFSSSDSSFSSSSSSSDYSGGGGSSGGGGASDSY